jgi:hypothetical protein
VVDLRGWRTAGHDRGEEDGDTEASRIGDTEASRIARHRGIEDGDTEASRIARHRGIEVAESISLWEDELER